MRSVKAEKNRIEEKVNQLLEEIHSIGPVMRGSVTMMGKRHKQPYFSVSMKGKTKVMYLGNNRAKTAEEYAGNYKPLMELVEEMTMLNMELLKLEKP